MKESSSLSPATEPWAVILGCSAGTGAAIAHAVARDPGLHIFGIHRGQHPDSAAAVEADTIAAKRRVILRTDEAGTEESAARGAEAILQAVGRTQVRLFVHSIANASIGPLVAGRGQVLSARQIEKTFDSMAHSFVYWVRELVARDLLAPGARLLGLTNPIGDSLVSGLGLIAAAKAALEIYVRQLAVELGPRGYRVNLLNFGLVDTAAGRIAFPPEIWERVKARASRVTPARRLCTVEEVGRFVSLLAGDATEWFNSATIDFTGGMTHSLLGTVLNQEE